MVNKMYIDQLIKAPVAWMSSRNTGIVISSRIRLARDIKGAAFLGGPVKMSQLIYILTLKMYLKNCHLLQVFHFLRWISLVILISRFCLSAI